MAAKKLFPKISLFLILAVLVITLPADITVSAGGLAQTSPQEWIEVGDAFPGESSIAAMVAAKGTTRYPGSKLILGSIGSNTPYIILYDLVANRFSPKIMLPGVIGYVDQLALNPDHSLVYITVNQPRVSGRLFSFDLTQDDLFDDPAIAPVDLGTFQDEYGHGLVVGPDDKVYIGTCCQGKLSVYDPYYEENQQPSPWTYRGRLISDQLRITDLAIGPDGYLYGTTTRIWVTPPGSASLFRVNRANLNVTGTWLVLAGVRESWHVEVNPKDGKLYGGVGYGITPQLWSFDPSNVMAGVRVLGPTVARDDLISAKSMTIAPDGKVYAVSAKTDIHLIVYDPLQANPTPVNLGLSMSGWGPITFAGDNYLYGTHGTHLVRHKTITGVPEEPDDGQLEGDPVPPPALPPLSSGFQLPLDDHSIGRDYLGFYNKDVRESCPGGIHHAQDFYYPHAFSDPVKRSDYPKVYAVADGKVIVSKEEDGGGGYGEYIIIWHKLPDGSLPDGSTDVFSVYAHLLEGSRRVQQYQNVRRGDWIGRQGSSGGWPTMDEHLHFELRKKRDTPDSAKCSGNIEFLKQHFWDPLDFIRTHFWRPLSLSEQASFVTHITTEEISLHQGTIDPGEQTARQIVMVPSQQTLLVYGISFPGSILEVTIYRPDGSIYGVYLISVPPEQIEIPNPEEGNWSYSIRAVDVPYSDYPYAVSIGTRDAPFIDTGENHASDPESPNEVDALPPVTSLNLVPETPNGQNGWFTVPVEIALMATDNSEGVGVSETRYSLDGGKTFVQYQGPITIDIEGLTRFDFYSIDGLGNKEDSHTFTLKIDQTPPIVDAGGDVTVVEGSEVFLEATGDDAVSGSLTYAWDLDHDGLFETPGKSVTFSAVDIDGPSSHVIAVQGTDASGLKALDQVTVSVENAPPQVSLPVVSPEPSVEGNVVTVNTTFSDQRPLDEPFTCSIDFGDGVGEVAGTVNANTCISPDHTYVAAGSYLVKVIIQDKDGGVGTAITTHQVIYNFSGFFWPVDNPPTINVVNAGRAIPVKFSLFGDKGLNIFADGYPRVQAIACDFSAPLDVIEETVTAGASNLTYKTETDRYTYAWKTQATWSGTCKQLIIKFIDGTLHIVYFKFR